MRRWCLVWGADAVKLSGACFSLALKLECACVVKSSESLRWMLIWSEAWGLIQGDGVKMKSLSLSLQNVPVNSLDLSNTCRWSHTFTAHSKTDRQHILQRNSTFISLFLHVVAGVETGSFWHCLGDTSGWCPIGRQIQGEAMRPCPYRSATGAWERCRLDFWMPHFICDLENSRYGGLHPAGLVDAGLSLKVASGLHLQAFVGAFRDTWATVEGVFETGTEPKTRGTENSYFVINIMVDLK